jgi:CheY-like chemotaxis protein
MRLLVAEDLKAGKAHKSALKSRGHIVTYTSNGEDCLNVYNDELQDIALRSDLDEHIQPFDVVVLDYDIPKMNGIEVTKEILTVNPHQRIIFISSNDKALSKGLRQLKKSGDIDKALYRTNVRRDSRRRVHLFCIKRARRKRR